MRKTMTQCDQVIDFLRSGHSLTRLEAMVNMGIGNLPARIKELRCEGYGIETRMVERNGKPYARYVLTQLPMGA